MAPSVSFSRAGGGGGNGGSGSTSGYGSAYKSTPIGPRIRISDFERNRTICIVLFLALSSTLFLIYVWNTDKRLIRKLNRLASIQLESQGILTESRVSEFINHSFYLSLQRAWMFNSYSEIEKLLDPNLIQSLIIKNNILYGAKLWNYIDNVEIHEISILGLKMKDALEISVYVSGRMVDEVVKLNKKPVKQEARKYSDILVFFFINNDFILNKIENNVNLKLLKEIESHYHKN
jgi:hypothetical protein